MAELIIENFANGLDLRRSADTAPPGSLRVLRNAFINEGGEIEKRKAFVKENDLTTYCRAANYIGKVTGPHSLPGRRSYDSVFFRHRHNSLPSSGWTASSSSNAVRRDISTEPFIRVFSMKSTQTYPANQFLVHASSQAPYKDQLHVFEAYGIWTGSGADINFTDSHIEVQCLTSGDFAPDTETVISANANREFIYVLNDKAYVVDTQTLYGSAVGDPGDMAGTGAGSVQLNTQSSVAIGMALGLGEYYGDLAVFGRSGMQFWGVDPDFSINQYLRTINIALASPRSIQGYGDGDILYLDQTGVRSVRARDSSNMARVSDVGSPIDKVLKAAMMASAGLSETLGAATANNFSALYTSPSIVNPGNGHFWLAIKNQVYVLSAYPDAGVRAWATFDMPDVVGVTEGGTGEWVADWCTVRETVMMRNFSDQVFIYGGTDNETYDATEAEVITPFMDMGRPGFDKDIYGIDLSCVGEWTVEIALDPANVVWEEVATIENSSFRLTGLIPFEVASTHIALRLTTTSELEAKIGQIVIYYRATDEK